MPGKIEKETSKAFLEINKIKSLKGDLENCACKEITQA